MRKTTLFLIVLSVLSFVFVCIATGGNAWVKQEIVSQDGTQVTERGLWKYCLSVLDECSSYTVTSSYLMACRALAVISSIFSFGALILSILGHSWHVKPYVLSVIAMGAGVLMFIATIVYISKNVWISQPNASYGWSFIMSWVSIVSHLITACVSLILARYHVE